MRLPGSVRGLAPAACVLLALATMACASSLRFEADRLERRCDLAAGTELSARQAVCVGRLAGLKDTRRCPLEVTELAPDATGEPAYEIRETCGKLALRITRTGGEVIGVRVGDAVAELP